MSIHISSEATVNTAPVEGGAGQLEWIPGIATAELNSLDVGASFHVHAR